MPYILTIVRNHRRKYGEKQFVLQHNNFVASLVHWVSCHCKRKVFSTLLNPKPRCLQLIKVLCTNCKTIVVWFRFSDFHVNEIDPSGNVIELTSFKIPEDPIEEGIHFIIKFLFVTFYNLMLLLAKISSRSRCTGKHFQGIGHKDVNSRLRYRSTNITFVRYS